MKLINEDNIKEYIEKRLPNSTWSEIFFEMKKEVDKILETKTSKDLVSINYNFTPIFMYYAIEAKISLLEFEKILQISPNYEYGINRFFGRADCDYEESKGGNIYDKMNYLFYKSENEKVFFDEEKIPYVKEIIKNVRDKNLLDFHSSRIDYFLAQVIYRDNKVGEEILDTISNTELMWKEDHRNYHNLIISLVENFGNSSYELDVSEVYKLFKKNDKIYKALKNHIISLNMDYKYKTNLSTYQMIHQNEENYFDIYMERVNDLKRTVNEKESLKLLDDISYSVKESIKKKPFKFNVENIDTNMSTIENIPYFIVLEQIIESGNYSLITGKTTNLKNYIKSIKDRLSSTDKKMSFEERYKIEQINLDVIEKFFEFQNLDKKFKEKHTEIKSKGVKI